MTKKNMILALFMAFATPLTAAPAEGLNYPTSTKPIQLQGSSTATAHLIGPTGPTGPRGPRGRPGPQGDDGPRGADGNDGHDGANGHDGVNGQDGINGIDGTNGLNGERGPRGKRGTDGAQGEAGPAGADGAQGEVGPAGADGPTGPSGADGAQGPMGLQGPAGPAGPIGPTGPAGETGPAAVSSFGDFYAQTTFDNPNPILPGETLRFSSIGHNSGGVVVDPYSNSDTFVLPVPGAYLVLFQANVAESGAQLVLALDRGCGYDEISASRVSSAVGPTQIVGMYVVRTRGFNERIQVRNAETSSTPITLTVNCGSPFSAHVLITQLQ